MGTDIRRHTAPLPGETPRRRSINDLSLTVNDIVPVANVTERAELVDDLNAASVGPSASRPLYVDRADAAPGMRLESTIDGTTWITQRAQSGQSGTFIQSITAGTGYFGRIFGPFPGGGAHTLLVQNGDRGAQPNMIVASVTNGFNLISGAASIGYTGGTAGNARFNWIAVPM